MKPWLNGEPETEADELPLLQELDRLAGAGCVDCGRILCGHEVLFCNALGFKNAPRCLACLASGLERVPAELRDDLYRYLQQRPCYERAWHETSRREGMAPARLPTCLWPREAAAPGAAALGRELATGHGPLPSAAATWDAGTMSCGDLVLALRGRLGTLAPGAVLKIIAHDPAAPEDLPAWCRLTGHRLLQSQHPEYYIQRKGG